MITKNVQQKDLTNMNLISTTQISKTLGITVSGKLLSEQACSPNFKTKTGSYWYADRFPEICFALIRHIALKGESESCSISANARNMERIVNGTR